MANVIDEVGGKEFRNAFGERYADDGDGYDGPNIVDPVGKKILEVNCVMEIRYSEENDSCGFRIRIQDAIESRLDQKRRIPSQAPTMTIRETARNKRKL